MGGRASDRGGEIAHDQAIPFRSSCTPWMYVDVRMYSYGVDGVIYVFAVVLSALYIVNKSKPLREVEGISEEKNEGAHAVFRAPRPDATGHITVV